MTPPRSVQRLLVSLVWLCGLAVAMPAAQAGVTDPTLVLLDAEIASSGSARTLTISLIHPFDDAMQGEVALGVLLREADGPGFLLVALGGAARAGESSVLLDGVGPADLSALSGEGEGVVVDLVDVGPDRLVMVIPPVFDAGSFELHLFAEDADGAVLSNPLDVGAQP